VKILIMLLWFFSVSCFAKGHETHKVLNYVDKVVNNNKFDHVFKLNEDKHSIYVNRYVLKALCGIESGLNPRAISSEGALGLCQIIPSTWKYIKGKNKNISISSVGYFDANQSVKVAKHLLLDLRNVFSQMPDNRNTLDIVLSSYNAGPYNIQKAMKLCHSENYDKFKSCLGKVTSKSNAKQTTDHVDRVEVLASILEDRDDLIKQPKENKNEHTTNRRR